MSKIRQRRVNWQEKKDGRRGEESKEGEDKVSKRKKNSRTGS